MVFYESIERFEQRPKQPEFFTQNQKIFLILRQDLFLHVEQKYFLGKS